MRHWRLAHHLTQREVAHRADLDIKTIMAFEGGQTSSRNTLVRLSPVLGVAPEALEMWLERASEPSDGEGADLQLGGGEFGEEPVVKSDRAVTADGDAVLSVERAARHLEAAAVALGGWVGVTRGALGAPDPNPVDNSVMEAPAPEVTHRHVGTSDQRRVAAATVGRDVAVAAGLREVAAITEEIGRSLGTRIDALSVLIEGLGARIDAQGREIRSLVEHRAKRIGTGPHEAAEHLFFEEGR